MLFKNTPQNILNFIFLFLFVCIIVSSFNASPVRLHGQDLETVLIQKDKEIELMRSDIENLKLNQKNLYSNDSLIVVKQNQYQSKQQVKGFLSLLMHML